MRIATSRRSAVFAGLVLTGAFLVTPARSDVVVYETWIVRYDAPPTAAQLADLSTVAVATHGFAHLPAAVAIVAPALVPALDALSGVTGIEANLSLQLGLHESTRTINADDVWTDPDLGYTGTGIGVAIVDAGVDGGHPDLCVPTLCPAGVEKLVQNVKFIGRQDVAVDPVLVLEDQITTDSTSGHGTHVAGIVGGRGVASSRGPGYYAGVAPGSRLIGLGTGEAVEVSNVLAAFDWILENHDDPAYEIKVVNNSWGPGAGHGFDPDEAVQVAISALHDAGLTVVFGAGNDGPASDTLNAFSVNPDAISVAGGTKAGHNVFFSSRGIPDDPLWHPTVTAPGYNIVSDRASTGFVSDVADASAPNPNPIDTADLPYYASGSGTSMAAPHVAGVVALMQQASYDARGVYLTPDEVKRILQNTAVSLDPARGPGGLPYYQDYTMGAGYVDALAATRAARDGTSVQPYDDLQHYEVTAFSGDVGPAVLGFPTQSFAVSLEVAPGATSLDLLADWGVPANDIDVDLHEPDDPDVATDGRTFRTFLLCDPTKEPNAYSSFCTQKAYERINVAYPVAGTWRAVVHGGLLSAVDTVRGRWSVVHPDLVPAAPTGLIATTGPGRGQVALSWSPPATDGGQPVASYTVYRNGTAVTSPTATSWLDTGLGDGVTSSYAVTARNLVGESPASTTVPGTTFALPTAPTGLAAAAGPGAGQVSLGWTAPGMAVTGYDVYRGTRTGRLSLVGSTATTAFTDSALGSGKTYFYAVAARNPVGASTRTADVSATTFSLPGVPAGFTAVGGPGPGQVSLGWSPPTSSGGAPVTSYRVYRGTTSKALSLVATVSDLWFVDSGLTSGSQWSYAVSAVTIAGEGKRSGAVRVRAL